MENDKTPIHILTCDADSPLSKVKQSVGLDPFGEWWNEPLDTILSTFFAEDGDGMYMLQIIKPHDSDSTEFRLDLAIKDPHISKTVTLKCISGPNPKT